MDDRYTIYTKFKLLKKCLFVINSSFCLKKKSYPHKFINSNGLRDLKISHLDVIAQYLRCIVMKIGLF